MRRSVLALNRVLTLLLGLVVLGLGLGFAAWGAKQLKRVWGASSGAVSTHAATSLYADGWWRWASGAAGVLLIVLALWWLLAHLPHRGVGPLRLPGSGRSGHLTLDGDSAAAVAADVLSDLPGVRSAHGRMVRTRGQLVAEMSVTAGPSTDLGELSERIDAVSADLHQVLSRDDVRARVRVHIARRDQAASRVS